MSSHTSKPIMPPGLSVLGKDLKKIVYRCYDINQWFISLISQPCLCYKHNINIFFYDEGFNFMQDRAFKLRVEECQIVLYILFN